MDLRVDLRGGGGETSGEAAFGLLVEHWIGEGTERRAVLEPARDLVCGPSLPMPEEGVRLAFGPVMSLLEHGMDGIPVTRSGAFRPEYVRELAAAHPEWAGIGYREISREADLPLLRNLRATLEEGGHLRLDREFAFSCTETAELARSEPIAAMVMLGCALVGEPGFVGETVELAGALLLDGHPLSVSHLAAAVGPAIREGWEVESSKPLADAIEISLSIWIDHAQAVGVLPDPWARELRAGEEWPGPVGEVARACLMSMLRFRVVRFMETGPGAR